MVCEMEIGAGGSIHADVTDLRSSVALPSELPLSALSIIGATAYMKVPPTTRPPMLRMGFGLRSHVLMMSEMVPRAPRYISPPCFTLVDALGQCIGNIWG